MASNPLSPAALRKSMAEALPTHEKGDTTSDISAPLDAISLFVHACMVSLGFRLIGFNEDQKIELECQQLAPRLPAQWNQSISTHSFVYAHTQSSLQFVIRVDKLGTKAEIRGLAVGDERIYRFEITRNDYISPAALPLRITLTSEGEEDRSDLEQKLKDIFISESRMSDLANSIKVNILQRLIPGLQKEGYQEDPDDRAARQDAEQAGRSGARPPPQMPEPLPLPAQPRPYPVADPLADPPRRPIPAGDFPPPDFEDEYEINRPLRGGFGGGPLGPSGYSDLYPAGLGPNDPIRGSFIGGGGLPRPGGFGGMHPTFDDPLFQGPGRRQGDGNGYDPQAPPGARWDPLGPGGQPRFGGDRPGGRGSNPFGGPGGGFGGDII